MFIDFFYTLRAYGLDVSLDEWLCLMDALDQGLAENSLLEFYYLCRNVLVKSESDYDTLDQAFGAYFQGIETIDDIPDELKQWLAEDGLERDLEDMPDWAKEYDMDTLRKMFAERLAEQNERHNGGNYWVGTGGTSPFGNGGWNPAGIRVGGASRHRSAVQVAADRNFRDFREDNELDTRQFQMAFRKLRQFSSLIDAAPTELDVDETIDATCDNAGLLTLVYEKPRRNTVKLLMLMDSDGSMQEYSELCSHLFQAADQSSHFKDFRTYYFHNCIYDHVYTDPYCVNGRWIDTQWLFGNLDSEYKVILVGDAAMSPYELYSPGGNLDWYAYNEEPGIDWLWKFRRRYRNSVWLNPIPARRWEHAWGARTISMVRDVFPMFELTLDGLDAAIRKLMSGR